MSIFDDDIFDDIFDTDSIVTRQYKTLGTMRSDLLLRLGFGASGASAGVIAAHVNLVLQEQQRLLWDLHDWARLRRYSDVTLGQNQYQVDYPEGADPDRIKAISINRGTLAGPSWSPPLQKGISPQMYTTQASTSFPARWEPYDQIELWPKADREYTVRVFFIRELSEFVQDDDRATLDDSLIHMLSLGILKAHYRQPDAKMHIDNAQQLLLKLKAKSWGKDVFHANDYRCDDVLAKPRVV